MARAAAELAIARVTQLEGDLVPRLDLRDRLELRVPAIVPARGALVDGDGAVDLDAELSQG